MATDPPYSTGIFETIVGVNFGGGLAVEFDVKEADNSHLTLSNGVPNFSKAIMAFWFRVPKATLDAAYSSWVRPTPTSKPVFNGITPLVVFGDDTLNGYKIDSEFNLTGPAFVDEIWTQQFADPVGTYELRDDETSPLQASVQTYQAGTNIPLAPCYIGIDSNREEIEDYDPESGDPFPLRNLLRINIQLTSKATVSGVTPVRTSQTVNDQIRLAIGGVPGAARSAGPILSYGPDFFGDSTFYIDGVNPHTITSGYEDGSSIFAESNTESFTMRLNTHEIKPDRWHFVLISFDVSGDVTAEGAQIPVRLYTPEELASFPDHGSISSTCKGWLSLDDVNYKGREILDPDFLDESITSRLTFEPNGLYTPNGVTTALTRSPPNGSTGELAGAGSTFVVDDSGFALPTYTYSPGDVTTAAHPVGAPASTKYATKIHDVEMGEFQMWTGQTLNTASGSNRRLFVDNKGKPVKPATAEKALGKPTLLLHGSANWIKGKNTGVVNVQADDPQNYSQNFEPSGKIIRYKPDPSLHGPQSPADLKKK